MKYQLALAAAVAFVLAVTVGTIPANKITSGYENAIPYDDGYFDSDWGTHE